MRQPTGTNRSIGLIPSRSRKRSSSAAIAAKPVARSDKPRNEDTLEEVLSHQFSY
jgi:hypothetical protein